MRPRFSLFFFFFSKLEYRQQCLLFLVLHEPLALYNNGRYLGALLASVGGIEAYKSSKFPYTEVAGEYLRPPVRYLQKPLIQNPY